MRARRPPEQRRRRAHRRRPVLDTVIGHLATRGRDRRLRGARRRRPTASNRCTRRSRGSSAAATDEIAFAESATRAWTMCFYAMPFAPGDRILTHRVEYASNYVAMLQAAQRDGVGVEVVPSTTTGEIDVDALAAMLDDRVRLVAITHVPSQGGLVNPAAGGRAVTTGTGDPVRRSTPASRSASCRSTSHASVATSSPRRAASSCAGRAAPASCTSRRAHSTRSSPPSPDLRCAEWTGPHDVPAAPRRPPVRAVGTIDRRPSSGSASRPSTRSRSGSTRSTARVGMLADELRDRGLPTIDGRDRARRGRRALRHRHVHRRSGRAATRASRHLRARG